MATFHTIIMSVVVCVVDDDEVIIFNIRTTLNQLSLTLSFTILNKLFNTNYIVVQIIEVNRAHSEKELVLLSVNTHIRICNCQYGCMFTRPIVLQVVYIYTQVI